MSITCIWPDRRAEPGTEDYFLGLWFSSHRAILGQCDRWPLPFGSDKNPEIGARAPKPSSTHTRQQSFAAARRRRAWRPKGATCSPGGHPSGAHAPPCPPALPAAPRGRRGGLCRRRGRRRHLLRRRRRAQPAARRAHGTCGARRGTDGHPRHPQRAAGAAGWRAGDTLAPLQQCSSRRAVTVAPLGQPRAALRAQTPRVGTWWAVPQLGRPGRRGRRAPASRRVRWQKWHLEGGVAASLQRRRSRPATPLPAARAVTPQRSLQAAVGGSSCMLPAPLVPRRTLSIGGLETDRRSGAAWSSDDAAKSFGFCILLMG